jgi:hypothetical protein
MSVLTRATRRNIPEYTILQLESWTTKHDDLKDSDEGDTQNYWGSGLCTSSGIKKLEHDISETRSVSILRWRDDTSSLGPLERARL